MKKDFLFCLFFVATLYCSCVKENDYIINKGVNKDNVLKILSIKPNAIDADSSSEMIIRVGIDPQTDSAQNITLTTDKGIINDRSKSETVSTSLDRFADFVLKSGQVAGPVNLRATVATSYFRDTIITFTTAYPDTIIVTPAALTVAANSTLAVSINLVKFVGYPSTGQTVLLSAVNEAGRPVGTFTYTGSYSPGNIINATYASADPGKVTLRAVVVRQDGTFIPSPNIQITVN